MKHCNFCDKDYSDSYIRKRNYSKSHLEKNFDFKHTKNNILVRFTQKNLA